MCKTLRGQNVYFMKSRRFLQKKLSYIMILCLYLFDIVFPIIVLYRIELKGSFFPTIFLNYDNLKDKNQQAIKIFLLMLLK